RASLLSEVCRILVEVGGYRMAWIGEAQGDEERTIRPLAEYGASEEFLEDESLVLTWADTEQGQMTGKAIRDGETVVCQEISSDPRILPWKDAALKRGFLSCIALPLMRESGTFGAVCIFASEGRAFQEEEIELLRQLAENLSFGLGALSERREKERMHEEKIRVLEEGDRLKDEFLSVISHELRTPLNVITGFGSLLSDEAVGPLNGPQQEFIGKMLDNADRMISVVESLLDYAGIRAGRLAIFPALQDYGMIVTDALKAVEAAAKEKKITLTQEVVIPRAVSVDSQRILQTLKNLLSNAVKFTPEGGKVRIKAFVEGDTLVTETNDTGIGLAEEDLARIFQPFRQLDMSLTREAGGTGIGLSICKAIVEAHGGCISASSEGPGQGASFRFRLPLV
ncbi:MAG: ATP-binding protein, partial [Bacteroidota bacterium]